VERPCPSTTCFEGIGLVIAICEQPAQAKAGFDWATRHPPEHTVSSCLEKPGWLTFKALTETRHINAIAFAWLISTSGMTDENEKVRQL
jgi:hypothetical protein